MIGNSLNSAFKYGVRLLDGMVDLGVKDEDVYPQRLLLRVLLATVLEATYMERVSSHLREKHKLPCSDTVLAKLGSQEWLFLWPVFNRIMKRLLARAKAVGSFDVPVDVALDYHDIPYYGKERSEWVIRRRARKGTRWFYRWATVSVIVAGRRFILACMPVKNSFTHKHVIRCLIHEVRKHVRCIRYVTLDREFHSIECLRCLDGLNLKYAMPAKERRKLLAEMNKHLRKDVYEFEYTLTNPYDSIQVMVKVAWSKSREKHIPYITNLLLTPDEVQEVYRHRWGIETGYRVLEQEFRPKTTSNKFVVRLTYMWLAIFLLNLWTLTNHQPQENTGETQGKAAEHVIAWSFRKKFLAYLNPG